MSTAGRGRETTVTATGRVSYREDGDVLERIDALIGDGVYASRSAAIRVATRQLVEREGE